jgi:signal transduction histidine kinase
MDKIELESDLDIDLILDKLTALGQEIRDKLSNIRDLTGKMEINPILQKGLDIGIKTTLEELVTSGKLTLKVITEIRPLPEPQFNSIWIEHREEIYRFFREALNNVIQHAQPPHGTATQVFVSLEQQGDKCTLVIANDGAILASTYRPKKGGYGTKIMDTVARELINGVWEISVLSNEEVRVTLSWHLPN